MGCNHEKLRCTNNRFFCLICGQEIQMPKAEPQEEPKAEQPAKKKKTTKKEG